MQMSRGCGFGGSTDHCGCFWLLGALEMVHAGGMLSGGLEESYLDVSPRRFGEVWWGLGCFAFECAFVRWLGEF